MKREAMGKEIRLRELYSGVWHLTCLNQLMATFELSLTVFRIKQRSLS